MAGHVGRCACCVALRSAGGHFRCGPGVNSDGLLDANAAAAAPFDQTKPVALRGIVSQRPGCFQRDVIDDYRTET